MGIWDFRSKMDAVCSRYRSFWLGFRRAGNILCCQLLFFGTWLFKFALSIARTWGRWFAFDLWLAIHRNFYRFGRCWRCWSAAWCINDGFVLLVRAVMFVLENRGSRLKRLLASIAFVNIDNDFRWRFSVSCWSTFLLGTFVLDRFWSGCSIHSWRIRSLT